MPAITATTSRKRLADARADARATTDDEARRPLPSVDDLAEAGALTRAVLGISPTPLAALDAARRPRIAPAASRAAATPAATATPAALGRPR